MNHFPKSCIDNHIWFRVLLKSMSRPGKNFQLPGADEISFETTVVKLLDTVLDPQASCCLIDSHIELESRLKSYTGAVFTDSENADFLLALFGDSYGKSLTAKRGRMGFPDEGATILFGVDKLSEGTAATGVRLTGPGIKDSIYPQIDGLAAQEIDRMKAINAEYPLGIDCIFVDRNGQLMCIPRSTRIGGN